MSTITAPTTAVTPRRTLTLTPRRQLQIFLLIVLAHWVEHLTQAFEIYVIGMKVPEARGGLGLVWPWLVTSETMHYFYAIVMLAGLIYLRKFFDGPARTWWTAALVLQVWHHIEHLLLLGQAVFGATLFGAAKATSIAQLIIPRVELHLFYNAVVFTPMVVAMYLRHRQIRDAEHRARRLAAAA